MNLLIRLLVMLIASAFAALNVAMFYLFATWIFGDGSITWPIVAAVFWVQESWLSYMIKQELRKDGYLA